MQTKRTPTFCKRDDDESAVHEHRVGKVLGHAHGLVLLELHEADAGCHWHGRVTVERNK